MMRLRPDRHTPRRDSRPRHGAPESRSPEQLQADTVIQEGDLVHVLVREEDLPAAEAVFAKGPEEL